MFKGILNFLKQSVADALLVIHSRGEIKQLYGVSLYRNAAYLMLNRGVTAVLGLAFWILVARLYSVEDVGLGSMLISVAMFLSFVGALGLGVGIIRILPELERKAHLLNFSLTLATFTSVVVAAIFLVWLPFWSPELIFIRENLIFLVVFIVLIATASIAEVATRAFVALRRAGFVLTYGIGMGLLKLALAAGFASLFKVFGIFASWGVAIAVLLAVCLFVFLPQLIPGYRPIPSFRSQERNELIRFSLANYVGQALWQLPIRILPLMVVNMLNAEANAYFYISWAMADLLLGIPMATSASLFAEGSYMEKRLSVDIRRSLKLLALLLIPAIIIFTLLGDKILLIFGRQYSVEGARLLWFLAPASLPASINLVYLALLRVEKKFRNIILLNSIIAFTTLILSYLCLPRLGILGVGVGWLAAQTLMALVVSPKLLRRLRNSK